ncbi:MAG: hypothetical protein RL582_1819 [Bacteroidota bacterium]|jgi:hypothetical protein
MSGELFREGIDFYYNELGYMVLTEKYHLAKGYCCGNGCLHCPFDFDAVPEPKRSQLIAQKNEIKKDTRTRD